MQHRRLIPILSGAFALGLLTSCARIPVATAEQQCMQTALQGGASNTAITIGIGTGFGGGFGNGGGAGIALTSDLPQSNDPAAIYNACVYRKSGQPPKTPFVARPEMKG